MPKVEPRNVTPLLSAIRNFLLGREHNSPLRFEDYYAARTQPPPNLPEGPAHILSENYYYSRDGRREVAPPDLLAGPEVQKKIASSKSSTQLDAASHPKTPGAQWKWD